jgi:hypothetical protein
MTFLQNLRGAYVINELAVWEFTGNKENICHISEQLAKAIIVSYNMGNFGPDSFNFGVTSDEEKEG